MEIENAILLIIILIGVAALLHKENNNNNDFKEKELTNLPYRKRYLLTKTEYSFYNALKDICKAQEIQICPKVRLEDLAEVTTKQSKMKYRGYIKSRHVDFTLCDSKLNVIAVVELDDYSHNTNKAKQTDSFKNQLFETIGIPLFRIIVCNNYTEQIQRMFEKLNLNIATVDNAVQNNVPQINDILEKQNTLLAMQNTMLQELLHQNKGTNNS